jgi:hypothetical protein
MFTIYASRLPCVPAPIRVTDGLVVVVLAMAYVFETAIVIRMKERYEQVAA